MKKAMEYAKATSAMEGLILSKEQEELILDSLNGKISEEEFKVKAKELANKQGYKCVSDESDTRGAFKK